MLTRFFYQVPYLVNRKKKTLLWLYDVNQVEFDFEEKKTKNIILLV